MLGVEPPLFLDVVVEGFAVDIGHAEKDNLPLLPDVKYGDDIRMANGRDRPCLFLEKLDVVGIGGVLRPQDLDRDISFQRGFHCPENGAHSALGNPVGNDIVTQPGSGNEVS